MPVLDCRGVGGVCDEKGAGAGVRCVGRGGPRPLHRCLRWAITSLRGGCIVMTGLILHVEPNSMA